MKKQSKYLLCLKKFRLLTRLDPSRVQFSHFNLIDMIDRTNENIHISPYILLLIYIYIYIYMYIQKLNLKTSSLEMNLWKNTQSPIDIFYQFYQICRLDQMIISSC
jgi:hypothetical protein